MTAQRTALVTGASSGIGEATALEFARRGYRVFAAARRQDALAEIAAAEAGIEAVPLDVTDHDSIRLAWAKIQAETGDAGVDVLVNNAGFALAGPIEVLSDDDVRRQFDTNVFGLLNLTRTVLPAMRARSAGRIINISSLVGRVTFPGMGVYGATKYAVEAVSDALRLETAPFGVKVILIEPGFVATNIGGAADATPGSGEPVPAAYRAMVESGAQYLDRQVERGMSAERVATVIADAAESRKPRTRYLIPASSKPLVGMLTLLPDRLADAVKLRAVS